MLQTQYSENPLLQMESNKLNILCTLQVMTFSEV